MRLVPRVQSTEWDIAGMGGLGQSYIPAPNFMDISNWTARDFAEGRLAYIQSLLTRGGVIAPARTLFQEASAKFARWKTDMDRSFTLPFLSIDPAQQQSGIDAETTFQRAVETQRRGEVVDPRTGLSPYRAPVFQSIPWWAWLAGAVVVGGVLYARVQGKTLRAAMRGLS